MNSNGSNSNSMSGFTLVEMLIYILLFGIVITSIYSLFISNVRSHKSQDNTLQMVQDLRGSIDIMVREIRMAGCDPEKVGGIGFNHDDTGLAGTENEDTDTDSIHFSMDITNTAGTSDDSDGLTDGPNENIVYYHDPSGNKILRRTGSGVSWASNTLAEKIAALVFTYYDASGNVLNLDAAPGDIANIRTVRIAITGETDEIDPMTRQKKTRTITTRVRVRNAGL